MTPDTAADPKPPRIIFYCTACKWAADVTDSPSPPFKCPTEGNHLSYVKFNEHEKARANEVLAGDIGKTVDGVAPYKGP